MAAVFGIIVASICTLLVIGVLSIFSPTSPKGAETPCQENPANENPDSE